MRTDSPSLPPLHPHCVSTHLGAGTLTRGQWGRQAQVQCSVPWRPVGTDCQRSDPSFVVCEYTHLGLATPVLGQTLWLT